MGPPSAASASPSSRSLQYLCERLAQREAEYAKLDDKYIQREKFATSHEARLVDMQAQLTASCLDCETWCTANDDMLKNQTTERQALFNLCARALKLKTELKAPRVFNFDLADEVGDRNR